MKNKEWGSGEWDNEPDEESWVDEYSGYKCNLRRAGCLLGYWCGYVALPSNHPYYNAKYKEMPPVNIHGGVTFPLICDGDKYWIGFDCCHYCDIVPYDAHNPLLAKEDATYKNIKYVKDETISLARQLYNIRYMNFFQAMNKLREGKIIKNANEYCIEKCRKFKFENGIFLCMYDGDSNWDNLLCFRTADINGKWMIVK